MISVSLLCLISPATAQELAVLDTPSEEKFLLKSVKRSGKHCTSQEAAEQPTGSPERSVSCPRSKTNMISKDWYLTTINSKILLKLWKWQETKLLLARLC